LDWLRETRQVEPALRLIRALRLHWFNRGIQREGLEYTLAITALPETNAYPALRADALTAASFLARELGEYGRAYDITRASLEICHQIHDRQRAADALVNLGFIALQQGQIDDARSILQRSLTTNADLKNEQGFADSLGFLALTDLQLGDLATAGQRLETCCAIWSRLDDIQGVAWAKAHLGLVQLAASDYRAAWDALMTSLDLGVTLDFRGDIYLVFEGLARLAICFNQPRLACDLAAAAASIREQSGIRVSAKDQERADRLLADLRDRIDRDAIEDAWNRRHEWSLNDIRQMTVSTLGDLVQQTPATQASTTLQATHVTPS
jgi:tetratricopeptide (TPR) repeat protein